MIGDGSRSFGDHLDASLSNIIHQSSSSHPGRSLSNSAAAAGFLSSSSSSPSSSPSTSVSESSVISSGSSRCSSRFEAKEGYEDAAFEQYKSSQREQQQQGYCGELCNRKGETFNLRVAGLSMSGKSTFIRYLLHHIDRLNTAPTNEMEVSRVLYRGNVLTLWDSRKYGEEDSKPAQPSSFGLQLPKDKPLIARQQNFDALIYLVDSQDKGRLKITAKDFERCLKTYHSVPAVLVLANKIDLLFQHHHHHRRQSSIHQSNSFQKYSSSSGSGSGSGSSSSDRISLHYSNKDSNELKGQLRVMEFAFDKECEVFSTSCVSGEGIEDALQWLISKIKKRENFISGCLKFFTCSGPHAQDTVSCGPFGTWDPLSLCRYSRLS